MFEYSLEVKKDIIKDINNFIPVNFNNKNNDFRFNKNHQPTNVFYKNNVFTSINNRNKNIGGIIGNNGEIVLINNNIPGEIVPKQNQNGKNINIKIVKK